MSKTKTPFFSFDAQGSVGGSITAQRLHRDTLIRGKPFPTDRRTLLQMYQRWLYEDYAYLWRQQTQATRLIYAAYGTTYHLTGFQYWMKYHLKVMPDIMGFWTLDRVTGAIAYDRSPNNYDGTIFGASPVTGLIDGALGFDGFNDSVNIPDIPNPNLTALTVLFFNKPGPFTGSYEEILYWNWGEGPSGLKITRRHTANNWRPYFRRDAVYAATAWVPFTPGQWYLQGLWWDGTTLKAIQDAVVPPGVAFSGTLTPTATLYIGRQLNPADPRWWDSPLDNLIIFNRALDDNEIARWAGRRYPPQ